MMIELDKFAHIASPLQRWDPRWKLIAAAVAVAGTVLLRHIPAAGVALSLALALVAVGRLPLGGVVHRLRHLGLLIVLVAVTLVITAPGSRVSVLGLSLSAPGLRAAVLIALKASAILLILIAMTSTTPVYRTLAAMESLRIPRALVQVVHLTYRYMFLIQAESAAIRTAMLARGFRFGTNRRTLGLLGNVVGMLLIRSTERADRVYLAMQARGFRGSFTRPEPWQTRPTDILGFFALLTASVSLVIWDCILPAR